MEIEIYHVDQAINGSKEALGAIIENIEGPVFNLSLRMGGLKMLKTQSKTF